VCGIAGVLALEPGGRVGSPALEGAIKALGHRGPDEVGRYVDEEVAFGHTRLSIVDLSSGQQPMPNEDGSIWVVFNGEIYNHIELRAELTARGHSFRTRCDTEVIAQAYQAYGLDFPSRFNGQFSIGLWDRRRHRLVLVRDRMGVRPLYYTRRADRLAFASEVKSLRELADVGRALDHHTLGQTFTLWAPLSPRSSFADIESLPAGHLLVAENGTTRVQRYWDWRLDERPDQLGIGQIDQAVEELQALLTDAVRLRLRSDVPVGAYLSGGLDSSIITTLIKTRTDTPLRTFSLTFEDAEYDESSHQQALIHHLQADHSSVVCSRRDIGRAFPRTIFHTECPVLRTAPTPMLLLSDLVRRSGYKVVLTGEGADEVFGGYDIFKEAQIRRFWARRPDSKLRPTLLRRLYPYLGTSPATSAAYAESFFKQGLDNPDDPFFAHRPRWNTTRRTWGFFSPELRGDLHAMDAATDLRATLPDDYASWPPFARDQYVEGRTLLSEYLLSSQGDRMGMASSTEGRFPFLDHRVLELSARLAPELKMFGLKEKFILKRAFGHMLPEGIVRRPKQPYRAPDSSSFFVDEQPLEYVAALLSPDRLHQAGYFDAVAVSRLVEKCRRGKAAGAVDNMAFVGILSTMLLDEMFVRGTGAADLEKAATPLRRMVRAPAA
jgi:asparagine synthase (glutamine-hydrolysing)